MRYRCKSTRTHYDVVTKDTSRPQDGRLRVVIAKLRDHFAAPGSTLQWIDNSMMLADALTKLAAERQYLLDAVKANSWSDKVTEAALDAKRKIREGRHARAEVLRKKKLARRDEELQCDAKG